MAARVLTVGFVSASDSEIFNSAPEVGSGEVDKLEGLAYQSHSHERSRDKSDEEKGYLRSPSSTSVMPV